MSQIPDAKTVWRLLGEPRSGAVLIDGRSGSGKTSLAAELAPLMGATIVHMDDLYHGWYGLEAAPAVLVDALAAGRYRRYDWYAGRLTDVRELDATRPIVIEGCGSLTRSTLEAAAAFAGSAQSIWLECPYEERKARALGRDGSMLAPYWEVWEEQEDAVIASEHSRTLADLRFSTSEI